MILPAWKRVVVLVSLASLGAALLAACGPQQAPPGAASPGQPGAVAVNAAPATAGSISVSTSYAAIVEATNLVDVVPQGKGWVEKVNVDTGSEIKKGQVIAEVVGQGEIEAPIAIDVASNECYGTSHRRIFEYELLRESTAFVLKEHEDLSGRRGSQIEIPITVQVPDVESLRHSFSDADGKRFFRKPTRTRLKEHGQRTTRRVG